MKKIKEETMIPNEPQQQIQEQERYKRMTADELFRSYTASEWR